MEGSVLGWITADKGLDTVIKFRFDGEELDQQREDLDDNNLLMPNGGAIN